MDGCTGGTLDIRNITALCNSSVVELKGDGTWDVISIENVRNNTVNGNISPFVSVAQTLVPQTIKQLRISRFFNPLSNGGARSAPAFLFDIGNIDNLDFVDCRGIQLQANINWASITAGAGTAIKSISFTNCTAIAAATGTSALLSVTGATPITSISFNNCLLSGAGTGFMLTLGAAAAVTAGFFNNCNLVSSGGFLSATAIGRLNGSNVQFDGAKITGTPQPGDIFYNTNAAFGAPGIGLYARGSAAFTRIAA